MPALDNPRHEKFCQAIARGKKGGEAYREVYGKQIKNPRGQASDLIRDNQDISARIKELQAMSNSKDVMALQQQKEYLTKVLITPIGEIDESSVFCQVAKYTETGREFKMIDKLGAITQLARLMGLMKENAVEIGVNVNVSVMSEEKRAELMRKKQQALERRGTRVADGIPGKN